MAATTYRRRPPPVHSFIQPIMKGRGEPARLPTELMKAMPPATPCRQSPPESPRTRETRLTPIADTLSAAMASTGLPMQAAVASPPTSVAPAQCRRRSPVLSGARH